MNGRRIALATSGELPNLWEGDRVLLSELLRRGWTAAPAVWDDEAHDWSECDVVLIRSCWDYHLKADRFRNWLDRLSRLHVTVINSPEIVRWNLHKAYLLDIERAGGRIPPTRLIARGTRGTLADHIRATGWQMAVMKPAISATGYSTRLVEGAPARADEEAYASAIAARDVLLQAYVPEVVEGGEWSFVFLGGRYSHAVIKRAAAGEFRVHIEWGGTVETATPSPGLVRQAEAILRMAAPDAVYARVDAAVVDDALVLMELELIEPELFFDREPRAAGRLAGALEERTAAAKA